MPSPPRAASTLPLLKHGSCVRSAALGAPPSAPSPISFQSPSQLLPPPISHVIAEVERGGGRWWDRLHPIQYPRREMRMQAASTRQWWCATADGHRYPLLEAREAALVEEASLST